MDGGAAAGAALLLLALVAAGEAAAVLRDGGYEGLLAAVHPWLPEDGRLLASLQVRRRTPRQQAHGCRGPVLVVTARWTWPRGETVPTRPFSGHQPQPIMLPVSREVALAFMSSLTVNECF